MKILYVTTIGATMAFFESLIRELLDEGHTVDIASNDSEREPPECYKQWGCRIFSLSCSRSPLNKGNWTAIGQIRALVEREQYDIVHCHTPIASVCTRLACRKLRKKGNLKVYYTAHGFHFYKGAPLKNWMIFYPAEKICSYFTDVLITINREDYALAKRKMKAGRIEYVPGVGIDLAKFRNVQVDIAAKRREIGVPEDAFLLLSVGELNENKNHQIIIRAMGQAKLKDVHYIIAGQGALAKELNSLADKLGIGERVHLLGFREDVAELYTISDLFVFPSYREGLSVSVMEAMASGLPCAVSRIRGNVDLIDEYGGVFFDPNHVDDCMNAVVKVVEGNMDGAGKINQAKAEAYSADSIASKMKLIYSN